jgi:hypothetical protein
MRPGPRWIIPRADREAVITMRPASLVLRLFVSHVHTDGELVLDGRRATVAEAGDEHV